MDFNQYLLIAGLGLLGLVIILALFGFLAGLKRELRITATFLILLLLAWFVFGNASLILDSPVAGSVAENMLGVSGSTLWEVIVNFVIEQNIIPNGDALLVANTETYDLVYNLANGLITFVLIISFTIVMFILMPIIRLISWIVRLIIDSVKKNKAKKRGTVPVEEKALLDDSVLVLEGPNSNNDIILSVSENKLPKPAKTKKRWWGAFVGALKGVFLIIVVFVPISGVASVLGSASPETRNLVASLMSPGEEKTAGGSQTIDEMAFDFADAYYKSAIGKFVEGSSYFFGDSISALLFDGSLKLKTDQQTVTLRKELITFIEAINALNGKTEIGSWTNEEIANAISHLQDSELLPVVMPVVIEFAAKLELLENPLKEAEQTDAFLQLRYIDWEKDLDLILEAIKVAYRLDIFADDFNYLTMDVKVLEQVVNLIGSTEFINKGMPVILETALKMEMLTDIIGEVEEVLNLSNIDWKKDLNKIVKIYGYFQELEITDLAEIGDPIEFVKTIFTETDELGNKVKLNAVENILNALFEMGLFTDFGVVVGQSFIDKLLVDMEYSEFAYILNIKALTSEEWKNDFKALLEAVEIAVDLNILSLDFQEMELTSDEALQGLKDVIEKLLGLNLLGSDDTKNQLVAQALLKFGLLSEEHLYVNGVDRVTIVDGVIWTDEIQMLQDLVDIFGHFANLEFVDIKDLGNLDINLVLESEEAIEIVVDLLETLVDSKLVMSLLKPLVEINLKPMLDDFLAEDETLFDDLLGELTSEEIVQEVIELVDVFKAALELGLLDVIAGDLSKLDYRNVEALKTIVNGIFESKLLEGFEGRIIRIVFKITGLLDLPKGALEGIDYQATEQSSIINFIDAITPILQDPNFVLFNAEGELALDQLDLQYFLSNHITTILVDALKSLLGEYDLATDSVNGGSELVGALLPYVYGQMILEMIPEEYLELTDVLGIAELTGVDFSHDISAIVYVGELLNSIYVPQLTVYDDVLLKDILSVSDDIIDTLYNLHLLNHDRTGAMVWIVNYALANFVSELNIAEVTEETFADVNWGDEKNLDKEVIRQIIQFALDNDLKSIGNINYFIEEELYLESSFLNTQNVEIVMDIVKTMLDSKIFSSLMPIALDFAIEQLNENGINLTGVWTDQLTGEMLVQDIKSLLDVVVVIVNDTNVIEFLTEDASLIIPSADAINEVLDILFSLNLLSGYEASLIAAVVEPMLPEEGLPFKFTDLRLDEMTSGDWDNFVSQLQAIVVIVCDLFANNEVIVIDHVMGFINELTSDMANVADFLNEENVKSVADVVRVIADMQIVLNVLPVALNNILEDFNRDFAFIASITDAQYSEDIKTIADILELVGVSNFKQYLVDQKIDVIDLEVIAQAVELLGSLNLVNQNDAQLAATGLNTLFAMFNIDIEVDALDYGTFDAQADFVSLAGVIREAGKILESLGLVSLDDVLDFVNAGQFINQDVINDNNAYILLDALEILFNLQVIKPVLPQAVAYGLDNYLAGWKISYLSEYMTSEDWVSDLLSVVNILRNAVDFGAIDIYFTQRLEAINREAFVNLFDELTELNVIVKHREELMAYGVNMLSAWIGGDERLDLLDFASNTEEMWQADRANFKELFMMIFDVIELTPIKSLTDLTDFINNQDFLEETFLKAAADKVVGILDIIVNLNVLETSFKALIPNGIQFVNKQMGYDLAFLNQLASEEIVHDLNALVAIIRDVIDFGAIDLYLAPNDDNTLNPIDYDLIVDLFEQLTSMNIYQRCMNEIILLVISITNLDIDITEVTLRNANWENDGERLVKIVEIIRDLMTENDLNSLVAIKDFMEAGDFGSLINDSNVKAVIDILDNIVSLDILNAIADPLYQFVCVNFEITTFDFSFIFENITGSEIVSDLHRVVNVLTDVLNFGALDLINGDYTNPVNFDLIVDVIYQLDSMYIVNNSRPDLLAYAVNMVCGMLDIDTVVSAADYQYINWGNEYQLAIDVIRKIEDVFVHANIASVDDILKGRYYNKNFVSEETAGYLVEILNMIGSMDVIVELANVGIEVALPMLDNLEFDLSFIETYTGQDLSLDLKTLARIIQLVVDFDTLDLLYGEKVIFDAQIAREVVAELANFKIYNNYRPEWYALGFNSLLTMIESEDYIYVSDFTSIDWEIENQNLQDIFELVVNFLNDNKFNSLLDFDDFFGGVYQNISFYTDENIDAIAQVLSKIFSFKTLDVVFPSLLEYGYDVLKDAGITLEFIKDIKLSDLADDSYYIGKIAVNAIAFGALEYLFDGTIENVDLEYVAEIVDAIWQTNIFQKGRGELVAQGMNFLFETMGLAETVSESDFDSVNWNNDLQMIKNIIYNLNDILKINQLTSLDSILDLIEQDVNGLLDIFLNKQTAFELANIVESVSGLQILEQVYGTIVDGVVEMTSDSIDLQFMKGNYSGSEVSIDLLTIADILRDAIEFGIIEIYNSSEIDELQMNLLSDVFVKLGSLNLVNKFGGDFVVLALDITGLAEMINQGYTSADFAAINWAQEFASFAEIIGIVANIMEEHGLISYSQVYHFLSEEEYLIADFYTDATIDSAVAILQTLLGIQVIEVVFPDVLEYLADELANAGYESQSITTITLQDVLDDLNNIGQIAKNAIAFGALEYLENETISNIQLEYVEAILEQFWNMNIVKKVRNEMSTIGLNMLFESLGYDITADINLSDSEWDADLNALKIIVQKLDSLLKLNQLNSLDEILDLTNAEMTDLVSKYLNSLNADLLIDILEQLVAVNLLAGLYADVLDNVLANVETPYVTIESIIGNYSNEEIKTDLFTIVDILRNAVAFGAIDLYNSINITFDLDLLENTIQKIGTLHLIDKVGAELVTDGLNMFAPDYLNKEYVTGDFEDVNFVLEFDTIASIVPIVKQVFDEYGVVTYNDLVHLIESEDYLSEIHNVDNVIDYIANALNTVFGLQIFDIILLDLVQYGIDYVEGLGFDISFLKNYVTSTGLQSDTSKIATIAKAVYASDVWNSFKYLDEIAPAVQTLFELSFIKDCEANWVMVAVTFLEESLGIDTQIQLQNFASVNWAHDAQVFSDIVIKIHQLYISSSSEAQANMDSILTSGFNFENEYITSYTAGYLVDVLDLLTDLEFINTVLLNLANAFVNEYAPDYEFVLDGVTNEMLQQDLKTLVLVVGDFVEFGLLDLLPGNVEIDYAKIDSIYAAVEKILAMNVITHDFENIICGLLEQLGMDTTNLSVSYNPVTTANTVNAIIEQAIRYLEASNITTLDDIMGIGDMELYSEDRLNLILDIAANVLEIVLADDLVAQLAFPVAEYYVEEVYPELKGLADIHNIYSSYGEFANDAQIIAAIIREVNVLALGDIIAGSVDIPWNETLIVTNVLDKLFSMDYFNKNNRLNEIYEAVINITGSVDMPIIDLSGIDLASDRSKLAKMYEYLANILTDVEFPFHNVNDFGNSELTFEFIKKTNTLDNLVTALSVFTETTIYHEIGGLFLVFLLPVIQEAAPDYYDALDLANYTVDDAKEDSSKILTIFESLLELSFDVNGAFYIVELDQLVDVIFDNLFTTILINGKLDALMSLVLADFVIGQDLGGYVFDDFNTHSVNWDNEVEVIRELIHIAMQMALNEGLVLTDAVAEYFEDFDAKGLFDKDENLSLMVQALRALENSSFLEENFVIIYESVIREMALNAGLEDYIDYSAFNNNDFMIEYTKVVDLFETLAYYRLTDYIVNDDLDIPSYQVLSIVLSQAKELYLVTSNYERLYLELIDALNVNVHTDIDLNVVDYDADMELLISQTNLLVQTLNALGIYKVSDFETVFSDIASFDDVKVLVEDLNDDELLAIVNLAGVLVQMSIVKELALPAVQANLDVTTLEGFLEDIQDVLLLESYDKAVFAEDLEIIVEILRLAIIGNLYSVIASEDMPFAWLNEEYALIVGKVFELNFLELYGQDLIEALSLRSDIDLTVFNSNQIDYKVEKDAIVEFYLQLATHVLSRSDFPYQTVQDFKDLFDGISVFDEMYLFDYDIVVGVAKALQALDATELSGQLLKLALSYASEQITFIDGRYFDPHELADWQLIDDYASIAQLLEQAAEFIFNQGQVTFNKLDSSLVNVEAAQAVFELVWQLNIFKPNYSNIIFDVLSELGVDMSSVVFANIDYDYDYQLIMSGIEEVLMILINKNILTARDLKATISDITGALDEGFKPFLKAVYSFLKESDVERFVNIVELLAQSTFGYEVLVPVYNYLVEQVLPIEALGYALIGADYTKTQLVNDLDLFARGLRSFYDSGVYRAKTKGEAIDESQIPALQEAIRLFGQMNILEYKKNDLVGLLDTLIEDKDLSGIDLSNVNIKVDADKLADMLYDVLVVFNESGQFKFTLNMMGNTVLAEAIANAYEQLLQLSVVEAILPWAFRELIAPEVADIFTEDNLATWSDAQIMNFFDDVAYALRAAIQMGVFSNNGIDFTDRVAVQAIADVIFNNITLSEDSENLLQKLVNGVYYFGIVPFTYENLDSEVEFTTVKEILKMVAAFLEDYKDIASDFSLIAEVEVQNRIIEILEKTLESGIFSQLFMPAVSGSISYVNIKYAQILNTLEYMDGRQFIDEVVLDVFSIMEQLVTLGIFDDNIQLTDAAAVNALLDFILVNPLTKDTLPELFSYLFNEALELNTIPSDFGGIDFVEEITNLKEFITQLIELANLSGVSLTDGESLKDDDFLGGLADVMDELRQSELLPIIIKDLMKKFVTELGTDFEELFGFLNDALNDDSYTNQQATDDLFMLLDAISILAELEYFAGNMDYMDDLTELVAVVDLVLSLNAIKGSEADFVDYLFSNIDFLDNVTIEYSNINWLTEKAQFINMLDALGELFAYPGFDINNININDFESTEAGSLRGLFLAFVDTASLSEIGQQIFPTIYVDQFEASLDPEYQGLLDLDTLPYDEWAIEFNKLIDMYFDLEGAGFIDGTFDPTYQEVLELIDKLFALQAVNADKEKWLTKILDRVNLPGSANTVRSDLVEDWDNELNAFIDLVNAMALLSGNLDNKVSDFNDSVIYEETESNKIADFLTTLVQVYSLRTGLLDIMATAISDNSDASSDIKLSSLESQSFRDLCNIPNADLVGEDLTDYNNTFSNYWNSVEIQAIAEIIAISNTMDLSTGINFGTVDLEDLRLLLYAISDSQTFAIVAIQGEGGIIDTYFQAGLTNVTRSCGSLPAGTTNSEWKTEIDSIISVFSEARNTGIVGQNGVVDVASVIEGFKGTSGQEDLEKLLDALASSEILRPVLPELMYNSMADVVFATYEDIMISRPELNLPALDNVTQQLLLSQIAIFALIEGQLPDNDVASYSEWQAIIPTIADMIIRADEITMAAINAMLGI